MSEVFASHVAPVHLYDEVDSTNTLAMDALKRGAATWTAFIARAQSAGRGRRGRRWHSPDAGHLYMSVIMRPTLSAAMLPQLTLGVGVALADAVESCLGVRARLKWPNDLVIDRRKVAGILCEGGEGGVVVGVGVNLTGERGAFPEALQRQVTTLSEHAAVAEGDRERLAAATLRGLRVLGVGRPEGVSRIRARWMERAWLPATVRLGNGVRVTACALDDAGGLVVEGASGDRWSVRSGEVVWVELGDGEVVG